MNPLIECIKHQEDTGFDPAQRFCWPALGLKTCPGWRRTEGIIYKEELRTRFVPSGPSEPRSAA